MPFPPPQRYPSSRASSPSGFAAAGIFCAAALTSAVIFVPLRGRSELTVLVGAAIVLGALICLHGLSLGHSQAEVSRARLWIENRDRQFRRLFHGTFDAVLVLDDGLVCREANAAAAQLFGIDERHLVGKSIDQLAPDPTEARRLRRVLETKAGQGQMDLMRADGARVLTEFNFPRGEYADQVLLMLRDRTALMRAEEAKARSLMAARSSLREAYALRRATSALANSDPMITALDNLLEILQTSIPYDRANILLFEDKRRFISAHQKPRAVAQGPQHSPLFDLDHYPWLAQALEHRSGILVTGTEMAPQSDALPWDVTAATWICVPLFVAGDSLGFLSLTRTQGLPLGAADLRLSSAMAVPVALAIYNCRLHEQAEIFRSELVQRLKDHPPA